MKLYLKQRVFTWGDKFAVYDQDGNDRYYVQGEVFSWGKKLHLTDVNQNEIAFIQQKVMSFFPRYYISINGIQVAEVVKRFSLFYQNYIVNGLNWTVNGDFFSHEYMVLKHGKTVAQVSKKWFTFGDSYEIDISNNVDAVTALSVVLVIDACIQQSSDNN